ncbi:K02A2.6-like, partial [Cordylochernes scorpioides]
MEREENRPFCHRWRDPTVFSGERGEDSQRWLSDFQRVARYNKWDDSMCLANVIFYLTGTAKCWFENFEEILNSWEEFKIKFCEIFGNKEDTARKAENILRTRAQTSGENVESYIQEVLLLCKQSNPRMSEGEKVSHLIKGVAEEVYQALVGKDISTVDQFVAFCRRFEAFKRMRVAPPRFNRLPNVTTISTAEPENLEALIRRIVREEVQKFMAPPSTFAAQDIDTPSPDLRDVIRSEIQQTLAPISAPRQPESFRPRRQYLPQNDQGYRRRTEGPPNNQRTQWRTEDDRPICFHCGRPGHVARYCRDRRQAFADARLGRETVDFGRPRTENYTMGESGSELSQGRFRNPSPYPHRGRFQAPRRTSQSPARRPSRSPSRRRRNVQALVDSGADYSVISEAFRRSIKAPVFKENGPLLRAADKKPIVTLGKCSLEVQIKGLDIIFDFVVAAECSHDVILGWDFFKATDAIIDCGENKLYLSEAEKSYEWKDLKLCAAMDYVIPPKSFGKIVVTSQDVFGSRDVVVTGSKRLQLEKGLFIPSSLVRFSHGRAVLWVTNSTHQSQVIPSDMKIGTMQDLEVGSISNLDACSEIAGKDEVTSPDVRECLISMISTDLEETKKNRLLTCLNEFSDIFDFEKKSFPVSGGIKHKIDTSDYPPVRQRPYRVSPAERRVIQSEVEKMMETKIIRPSSSPWASPVILVRKKDGSLRFCVDYRRLNKITNKDVYPLPRIDDALDTLSGSRYFSTMDMRSGYWQIEVDDKDREKTAFITPDGLYEFNVMPFGLCNAPATFERMIDNVLRGLKWDMCLCYLDDIVVYGSTFKEHLTRLYKVLRCIQQAGLCLNYKKCHFASRQITILGHVVNEFGTQPDPEKVKAIVHFPKPRNISETRSFLGLSSYYRRFIKSYANKSRPLNSLLKKDEKFIWGEEQDESFRILKQELGSSPVLGHFIEGAETQAHTDASGYGLGAVLVQIQNDAERPIAYASRTLTKAEKNYSTTEKECLAVVWALDQEEAPRIIEFAYSRCTILQHRRCQEQPPNAIIGAFGTAGAGDTNNQGPHYLRALDWLLGGTAGVVQVSKVNGHQLLGLANRGLAERLINNGLEVEGTLLRAFSFRKRAERITVGNLPFFVDDTTIINALRPYGRITSIAPKMMKAGPYTYTDGRREAFIVLHEGVTTERLPTRLDITIKGEAWPAYLSTGIKCSRCHGQGHRRANCPLLAGRVNTTSSAPPASPAGVPPSTAPAPPQRPTSQHPAPAPPLEISGASPAARAAIQPAGAPRPSPTAPVASPAEETPPAPPPVTPAPPLRAPGGSVSPQPAKSQPSAQDIEMTAIEESSTSSTASSRKSTREDLVALIRKSPAVSFAETDALGLGREEVLDLLSSKTRAQRQGPLLIPPQSEALAGIIKQLLGLKPGGNTNVYKILHQVKSELKTGPAAVPPTPTLTAPRPAETTPPAPHGEKTSPDIATPPPPLSCQFIDDRWMEADDILHKLNQERDWELGIDEGDIIEAIIYPEDREPLIKRLSTRRRSLLAAFISAAIERARDSDPF